jgi:hypothetical protein
MTVYVDIQYSETQNLHYLFPTEFNEIKHETSKSPRAYMASHSLALQDDKKIEVGKHV